MAKEIKKIALLTGGGDCPGLNAVIRAITKTAIFINSGKFGQMVCLKGNKISSDSLENVIGQKNKLVDIDGELVQMARKNWCVIWRLKYKLLYRSLFMKQIKKYLESRIGHYSFFFEDLKSGYTYGYNENVQMVAAGCMKLPIAVSLIKSCRRRKNRFYEKS